MIFVFGSNVAGRHGKGAALAARRQHGAVYGVGKGRTGNAYAIPTCDAVFRPLPLEEIMEHIRDFARYVIQNPGIDFQITRIGCGLAQYRDHEIAPFFADAPANCFFDLKWRPWLSEEARYWGTF